ncbi:MAG: hypothetical protein GY856_01445 [bacterium]|nr:hypothetical protein [bacterium]
MTIELNQIPHETLKHFNTKAAVMLTTGYTDGKVYVTTSSRPEELHETDILGALAECRRREKVHSICMTVLKLDDQLIEEATRFMANRYRIMSELGSLLRYELDVYVAYVITHYNPEQRPVGPLMVNIGGDCYRTDRAIKDLVSILNRTRDLAEAMIKKTVMIFPEIPALHGGKKGEWIILDRHGAKISGISEEAIIALGTAIMPKGIGFLNRYKEIQAREQGVCDEFPARNYIKPDSGSPDVLSGMYWRGERLDRKINMCETWAQRGVDMPNFTCLPASLGGTLDPSSRPTGYGVSTTTAELAKRYFEPRGKALSELKFLLEAAGGVGKYTIESLTQQYGVPAENITIFDKNEGATSRISSEFPVEAFTMGHVDFYETRLPDMVRKGKRFDVWINNGEGDNTPPEHIQSLIDAGIKVYTGGANNFLEVATEEESLRRIFAAEGWTWPDPATSGGGWTLAVVGILTRCQGKKANTREIRKLILDTITSRNAKLIADVLDTLPADVGGAALWDKVDQLIKERVDKTLALDLSPREKFEQADTTHWQLT